MKLNVLPVIILFCWKTALACEALYPADAKSYQGECKGGLAHGIGKAFGVGGYYEGEFRNGSPHGKLVWIADSFGITRMTSTNYWWNGEPIQRTEYERLMKLSEDANHHWTSALAINTVEAYESFAKAWPLTSQAALAIDKALDLRFEPIRKLNTIEAYSAFLRDFSNTPQGRIAQENIWKLSYEKISTTNDIGLIKAYSKQFPDSPYASQANEQITRILRRQGADKYIGGLSVRDFCVLYGHVARNEDVQDELSFDDHATLTRLTEKHRKARKLLINRALVLKSEIRLGMSQCELYASWGEPTEENRSVGRWGVHVQHVYDDSYVYTENGRVTAWQD